MTDFCRSLPASSRLPVLTEAREAQSASVVGHLAHVRLRSKQADGERLLATHRCLTEVKPLDAETIASILAAMRELSSGDSFNAASYSNLHVSHC